MDEENKNTGDELKELSKKSLVRFQYSCCGVNSFVTDDEYVPIVNPSRVAGVADTCTDTDRKDS